MDKVLWDIKFHGRLKQGVEEKFLSNKKNFNEEQKEWVAQFDPDGKNMLAIRYLTVEYDNPYTHGGEYGDNYWCIDFDFDYIHNGIYTGVDVLIYEDDVKDAKMEISFHPWLGTKAYGECVMEKLPEFAQKICKEYIKDPWKIANMFGEEKISWRTGLNRDNKYFIA